MEAVDLTSRNQRLALLFLTVVYPAIWLIGLAKSLTVGVPADSVVWAAFPPFLVSAAGAFGAIWRARGGRARGGRAPSRLQRCAVYTAWGWLVPYLVITTMAVSAFGSLWPALAILALPAPAFFFSRLGRERFLLFAAACIALAWLALLISSDAPASFDTRLLLPVVFTAGPLWSLAAYASLCEHVLHAGTNEPGGRHESKVAFVFSVIGVLLFFGLSIGFIMIAVSSMR